MYKKVIAEKFKSIINKMPESLKLFLTDYSAKDYTDMNARCYISKDEKSGYALTTDDDLISVFSLPGAKQGKDAINHAIKNGAKTLDCFDYRNFLPALYKKHGFVEVNRVKWNDDYAPANWDYERLGRPDIVFMQRK